MAAVPLTIAGMHFQSKQALHDRVKIILNSYKVGEMLEGDDAILVEALFDRHPERDNRMQGLAISHFDIRKTAYPTRSFFVVRSDGTAIDFSTRKCI